MGGGDFGQAEEGSDEDEGMEFLGVFREDRFGDAGAEALSAEDDLRVAMRAGELGFESAEGGGFDGRFGGCSGTLAVTGIFEDENIAGTFFDSV
jgi:hypothetical protein